MTHFPTHVRNAFLEWIDGGFPEATTVEERYIPRRISADELLRWFMLPTMCSDVMPGHACDQVAAGLDYFGDARGMTYGLAASALFVQRTLGGDAGGKYLAKLCEPPDVPASTTQQVGSASAGNVPGPT